MEDKKCCICFKPAAIKAIGCTDAYLCEKCVKMIYGSLK